MKPATNQTPDSQRLTIKAAEFYYFAQMTQAQISRRFGLSRQKVQRMLAEANDKGIVNSASITITSGIPTAHKKGIF